MKAETLKKSILQYAMQGKLVAQNPDDEPAGELLKRIKAEKEKLIKEGKILKKKDLPQFKASNIPFEIPSNWTWTYLSDVSLIQEGAGIRSYQYRDSGIQLLTVTNILESGIDLLKSTKFIDSNEYLDKYKHLTPQIGDIVTACSGGSWGKSAIYDKQNITMLNTSTLRLRFFSDLANNKYLYFITKSGMFKNQLECQLSGMQPNFGYQHYSKILIPLPPLAEQQRIVEKLEQILPLIEEYGKNEEKLSELNKTLPDKIKQSVLQYAVQGKLVPQNPKDEPASELLKRIKAEKEKLIKEGKIKREKPLPPITEEEIPHELPQGWACARLGNILNIARGGSPRPIQDYLTTAYDGLNWIKIGDSEKGSKYINSTKEKITKAGLSKTRYVYKGDFLLSNSMSFGRPYILNIDGCIHDGWLVLANIEKCFDKDFLYYLLSSSYIFQQFCGKVSGAVVKNLNTNKVSEAIVCIPPLAEQKRIVDKVEELIQLIDKLSV